MTADLVAKQSKQLDKQSRELDELTKKNARLERRVAWFERQVFGRKSEKREFDIPLQDNLKGLFDTFEPLPPVQDDVVDVPAYKRKKKDYPGTPDDSGLRFNENEVDIKDIVLSAPELTGPNADQYEIIRYEHTYRLAQQRSSTIVLRYKRPILKHKSSNTLISTPAPDNVFGKSYADVSFATGMLIDKFVYHLGIFVVALVLTYCLPFNIVFAGYNYSELKC